MAIGGPDAPEALRQLRAEMDAFAKNGEIHGKPDREPVTGKFITKIPCSDTVRPGSQAGLFDPVKPDEPKTKSSIKSKLPKSDTVKRASKQGGNSQAYIIGRLKRDNPALAAKATAAGHHSRR